MGGLGYLEVQEDLAFKGPIDKFIPDDLKKELLKLADLEVEDTIFFIADKEARSNRTCRANKNRAWKQIKLN